MNVAPPSLTPAQLQRRREIVVHWAWYVLFLYILGMAFLEGSFSRVGGVYVNVIAIVAAMTVAVALARYTFERPGQGLAIILALATAAGLYISGSHRYGGAFAVDLAALAGGAALALGAVHIASRRWPSSRWREFMAIIMIVGGWCAVSALSVVRSAALPVDSNRFAQIGPATSIIQEHAQRWEGRRVGVALSGGGYRAALFHSGSLHALETLGIRPRVLSTVSGGSIIGAYYAVGGDPVDFKEAVAKGRFNLKREMLLLHNAARLPFPMRAPYIDVTLAPFYSFSRADVQANMLRSALYHGRESWRLPDAAQPRLVIAATELAYGMQLGLIPDGIVTVSLDRDRRVYRGSKFESSAELDLADRVAISGAFPLAFPGRPLEVKVIPCTATGQGRRSLLLADGGIADNSGLDLLQAVNFLAGPTTECTLDFGPDYALGEDWRTDVTVVSDAGAIFGVDSDLSGIEVLSRAFDVVSAKSGLRLDGGSARPVIVSAAASYLAPHRQFLLDDDQPAELVARRSWTLRFDPRDGYPAPVLRALFALLRDSTRAGAQTELAGYLRALEAGPELDLSSRRQWSRNLSQIRDAGECRRRRESDDAAEGLSRLPGICEAIALRRTLEEELIDAFQTFERTSTLDDWPPREDVETLFRLGQMLVYKQWWELERALEAPAP